MKVISLSHPTKKLKGIVHLPASKSISNRALILKHVLGFNTELQNLSEADDTVLMQMALAKGNRIIHLKNAGTCMRFLTAYFAAKKNTEVTLLCDERMEKRPIHELVDALKLLGAEITYKHQEGYPPLQIRGKQLNGGHIKISAQASSQYISALLMIAPLCKEDLTIELTGETTSAPYIDMTVRLMQQFGINVFLQDNIFHISTSNIKHQTSNFPIESDWSAASYWYEMSALSEEAEILLPGLSLNSLQGDRIIADHMVHFGVETSETPNGILLQKTKQSSAEGGRQQQTENEKQKPELVLTDTPDLAPTLAVTSAATNSPILLTGLQNLAIKESNRIKALETELSKLGFNIQTTTNSIETIPNSEPQTTNLKQQTTNIQTYGDHRMAMAFAPLALLFDEIKIEDPEVVEKSYPGFWDDLKRTGFVVSDGL